MWYCLVKSKTGKSFTTFGQFSNEGEAIHNGQVACIRSGGIQYYPVEIPDKTPKAEIKQAINYQMFKVHGIQLEDIGKRHYKGGTL